MAKVDGDTIILGSAFYETGKYSTNGIHAKNGYNIAVDFSSKKGDVDVGEKSCKLNILCCDDESTLTRGAQLAERPIRRHGVKYMLGPYRSGVTKAIAPVTEKCRIPMMEAEGAARTSHQTR